MQKVVTIYLDTNSIRSSHATVEEHLVREMEEGWMVKSIAGFGGANEFGTAVGWFLVVLEKTE